MDYEKVYERVEGAFGNTKKSYADRFKSAASEIYKNKDNLTKDELLQLRGLYNSKFKDYMSNLRKKNNCIVGQANLLEDKVKQRKNSALNEVYDLNRNINDIKKNNGLSKVWAKANEKRTYIDKFSSVYDNLQDMEYRGELSERKAKQAKKQIDNIFQQYVSKNVSKNKKKVTSNYLNNLEKKKEEIDSFLESYISSVNGRVNNEGEESSSRDHKGGDEGRDDPKKKEEYNKYNNENLANSHVKSGTEEYITVNAKEGDEGDYNFDLSETGEDITIDALIKGKGDNNSNLDITEVEDALDKVKKTYDSQGVYKTLCSYLTSGKNKAKKGISYGINSARNLGSKIKGWFGKGNYESNGKKGDESESSSGKWKSRAKKGIASALILGCLGAATVGLYKCSQEQPVDLQDQVDPSEPSNGPKEKPKDPYKGVMDASKAPDSIKSFPYFTPKENVKPPVDELKKNPHKIKEANDEGKLWFSLVDENRQDKSSFTPGYNENLIPDGLEGKMTFYHNDGSGWQKVDKPGQQNLDTGQLILGYVKDGELYSKASLVVDDYVKTKPSPEPEPKADPKPTPEPEPEPKPDPKPTPEPEEKPDIPGEGNIIDNS